MRRAAIVDLPLPDDPTTATTLPGGRVRLKFFNIIYEMYSFFKHTISYIGKYSICRHFFYILTHLFWSSRIKKSDIFKFDLWNKRLMWNCNATVD